MTKRWEDAEDADFTITSAPGDGMTWICLHCSVHGRVSAAAAPRDLGELSVNAQSHYERKHLGQESPK